MRPARFTEDLQQVTDEVARGVMKMLARRGLVAVANHESNEPPVGERRMQGGASPS